MPKEIAHIALAEQIAAQLPQTSLFWGPVTACRHLFLYGAVAPDVPYFYLAGTKAKWIQNLTARFHTRSADSLMPVLNFLGHFPQKDPDALAFAAGVCCHLLCDTLFHPMVYYFAGLDNVHEGATARHRMFETAMDIHFLQKLSDSRLRSLTHLYRHLETGKKRFHQLFHRLYQLTGKGDARYLSRAILWHRTIQQLFFAPGFYHLLRGMNRYGIIRQKRFHSLVYPFRKRVKLTFFNRPVTFTDPCRGTTQTTTIKALSHKAAENAVAVLRIIESALIANEDLFKVTQHPDLPDIRPCLAGRPDQFKYWFNKQNLEQMLYECE
jgi:hypothetical protein